MKTLAACFLLLAVLCHAQDPFIVAHRGASKDAPENTLTAFTLAWEQGADAIEGDFHLTRDGHVVCIHDGNTKKTAGQNLVVKDSTLEELRSLDVGAYRGDPFKGTIIPTLAEVLASVPPRKKIYIEIKCGASVVPAMLAAIKESKLETEQIVVISFKTGVIEAVEKAAPALKTMWLASLKKNGSGELAPDLNSVLETLERIHADGFSSNMNHITLPFIQGVKEGGYQYHVWTVDDFKTAQRFQEWGAQSITTNVPGLLKKRFAGE